MWHARGEDGPPLKYLGSNPYRTAERLPFEAPLAFADHDIRVLEVIALAE